MAAVEVALRPMQAADLPAVTDLWVEAWAAAYPAIDFEARRAWFADHVAVLRASGAQLIVAIAQNRVAGLVTVDPATGHLDQIVVARAHQGQGVAEHLLSHAKRLSPAGVTLDVNQDNAPALRFYRKHGFAVVGETVNARGAPIFKMRWTGTAPDAAAPADAQAASNCSLASRA